MAKILIVDDSQDLLELFSFIFRSKGYEVQTAVSGDTCKRELTLFKPDLILMDIKLNGENGKEICKEIKDTNIAPHIPVILISANVELLQDYVAWGADDALEKPFEVEALLKKIGKYLPASA